MTVPFGDVNPPTKVTVFKSQTGTVALKELNLECRRRFICLKTIPNA